MHYMVERRDCGANDIEFFFYTNLVIQLSKPGWDLKDATLCKMARMSWNQYCKVYYCTVDYIIRCDPFP